MKSRPKLKKGQGEVEDFEIEVIDDPRGARGQEEAKKRCRRKKADKAEPEQEPEYGPKVQKRIQKLVSQRREGRNQAKNIQGANAQLKKRLERWSRGSQKSAEEMFNQRYSQTKAALTKAVEGRRYRSAR